MMIRPGLSLWLDLIRALAAITVILGHFAHIRFTRGDYYVLRELNVASDAVVVFFVISGLVIAYAAERDRTLSRFAFNRLTRLWTVIVPALLLTMAFDALGTSVRMEAYPPLYYRDLPAGEFLLRGLTFTPQWSGLAEPVRLGTNGPLWSLSYEAAYYALLGIALFLRGLQRIALLALTAFLAGFHILLLMPCWLLGVWVWRMIRSGAVDRLSPAMAFTLAVAAPAALVLSKAAGVDTHLAQVTIEAMHPVGPRSVLYYSDEFLWNTLIALLVAIHLLGMARLLSAVRVNEATAAARTIRWLAGGSFSLYVVHYPALHLFDATLPETLPGYDAIFLGLVFVTCFAFAALFERPLKTYRTALGALRRRRATA